MKKILILVNTYKDEYNDFIIAGEKVNIEVKIATFKDVQLLFDKKLSIYIHDINIEYFNLVYFRSLFYDLDLINVIASYCRKEKIKLVDNYLNKNKYVLENSKMLTYNTLIQHNLPIIPSNYLSEEKISKLENKFTYPIILKSSTGFQGNDIYLCKNKSDLKLAFKKNNSHLISQPFLENTEDYRILVIGNEVVGGIKRSRDPSCDFRNNASVGATTELYKPSNIDQKLAIRATKILDLSIAGIDLIFDDKDKQMKILEVNRAPQFNKFMEKTNIDIPLKIIRYLQELCYEL